MNRRQLLAAGRKQLDRLRHILPPAQAEYIRTLIKSEEGEWFVTRLTRLADHIDAMPKSYDTDGQGDDAIVQLHYYTPSSDWWIIEKDAECDTYSKDPEYPEPDGHRRAYGYVCLNGDTDCAEPGYVSLPHLFEESRNLELDLHWTPKPLREVKAKVEGTTPSPDPIFGGATLMVGASQPERSARPEQDAPATPAPAPPPERSGSPSNVIHLPGRRRIPDGFRI